MFSDENISFFSFRTNKKENLTNGSLIKTCTKIAPCRPAVKAKESEHVQNSYKGCTLVQLKLLLQGLIL